MRRLITTAVVVAMAAIGTGPAMAAQAPVHPARPPVAALQPDHVLQPVTPVWRQGHAQPVPTQISGNWSGWTDFAASGKTFTEVDSQIIVPGNNCADTMIGTSGAAFTDSWVGISNGPVNSALAQDGIESFCTGTSGHFGSGAGGAFAWYIVCCAGPAHGLQNFNLPASAVTPGSALEFRTTWIPNIGAPYCSGGDMPGCYQFVVYYDGGASHITKYQPCWAPINCGASAQAEAIVEDPGSGPPADPMIEWTPQNGTPPLLVTPNIQFDMTSAASDPAVRASDGVYGSMYSKTGEWTLGEIILSQNAPLPLVQSGDLTDGAGAPEPITNLGSGDTSFVVDCGVQLADHSFHPCPYKNY